MNDILRGMDGVLCHMVDVLVFGCTKAEHHSQLKQVLKGIEAAGITQARTQEGWMGAHEPSFLEHQFLTYSFGIVYRFAVKKNSLNSFKANKDLIII